jgi:hypothetical protein
MGIDPNSLCLVCGSENRTRITLLQKCAQCQSPLRAGVIAGYPRPLVSQRPDRSFLLIVGVLGLAGWSFLSSSDNEYQNYDSYVPAPQYNGEPQAAESLAPQEAPAFLAPPVEVKPGILWYKGTDIRIAPLQIVTPTGSDYYVKLVDHTTGRPIMAIFVQGGTTQEIDVPLGSFEMRYAIGETWYGEELLFGPSTTFSRAESKLDFYSDGDQVNGYTIELIKQIDGNLQTTTISASEF